MSHLTRAQKIFLFFLACVAGVAILGTVYVYVKSNAENEALRTFYPDETTIDQYKGLKGETVTITDSLGEEVTVVTLWASWSPYSRDELPLIDRLSQEFTDDVSFIALNRKESKEQANRFLATMPNYEHIKFVIDSADTYYGAVGGYAMPETIVYNRKGEVSSHIRVVLTEEILREAIKAAQDE